MIYLPIISNAVFEDYLTAKSVELKEFDLHVDEQFGYFFNKSFSDISYTDSNYQNDQAHSAIFRQHLDQIIGSCKQNFSNGSNLVEVGCGQGTFLKLLGESGFTRLRGFDPTHGGDDPRVVRDYLSDHFMPLLADGLILRHVLEHIPDPIQFLEDVERINGKSLKLVIEVPSMDWNIKSKAFCDFGYEHANYFTIASFKKIFKDCDITEVFSGQYLLVVADSSSIVKRSQRNSSPSDVFEAILRSSISNSPIMKFAQISERYWVWGAGGKGVLLGFHLMKNNGMAHPPLGIIDINPAKQNRFTASSAIPIVPPSTFFETAQENDLIFVSNPIYEKEIIDFVRANCKLNINFRSI